MLAQVAANPLSNLGTVNFCFANAKGVANMNARHTRNYGYFLDSASPSGTGETHSLDEILEAVGGTFMRCLANIAGLICLTLAVAIPAHAQKAQVFDGALLKCTTPEGFFLRQTDVAGEYYFSSKMEFIENKGSFVYALGTPQVFKTNNFYSFVTSVSLGGKISPKGKIIESPKPVQMVAKFGTVGEPAKLPLGDAELRITTATGAVPPMTIAGTYLKMGLTIGKYAAEPSGTAPEKVTQKVLDDYVKTIDAKPLTLSFHIGGKELARVGLKAAPSLAVSTAPH